MNCYQCDKTVTWLAPDSRCADCTRCTPDEVVGHTPKQVFIDDGMGGQVDATTLNDTFGGGRTIHQGQAK